MKKILNTPVKPQIAIFSVIAFVILTISFGMVKVGAKIVSTAPAPTRPPTIAKMVFEVDRESSEFVETSQAESTKPVETSQTESTKPVETSQAESTKPVETSQTESTKLVETSQAESTKPVETSQAESTKPVETSQAESTKPAESKPAESKPVESKPVESTPAETSVIETPIITNASLDDIISYGEIIKTGYPIPGDSEDLFSQGEHLAIVSINNTRRTVSVYLNGLSVEMYCEYIELLPDEYTPNFQDRTWVGLGSR